METQRTIQANDLLPPKKAAEYLGITTMTLWRWVRDGKITPVMLDHRHFHISELDRVKPLVKQRGNLLPPKKAAEYLGITTMTLCRWVRDGKITPVMLDYRHFHISELDRVKGLIEKGSRRSLGNRAVGPRTG